MSQVASAAASSRGSLSTIAAFLLGIPLGLSLLWMVESGPWHDPEIARYVSHPVEKVEVVLFSCALMALLTKLLGYLRERLVFTRQLLPPWSGKPMPVGEATNLLNHLSMQRGWSGSWLGRRVRAILDFVHSRRSANELDDQMRTLSDNDIMAQEGSYSLIRFINWAIPILGFLGTVVGITQAIANVDPSVLEQSVSGVTGGLATAFDATALALLLAMVLMFGMFITERLEQGLLEQVDAYVDRHLAHRFERTQAESGPYIDALRQNTQVMVDATREVVDKQAEIWAKSLEKVEGQWARIGQIQETQITKAVAQALEFALTRHGERLAELENKLAARNQTMLEGLAKLAQTIDATSRQHHQVMSEMAGRVAGQAETLARLQEGEGHLIRLQETLQQNLQTLAGAGAFEEAVQSLTAAIHLLTSRVQPAAPMLKKAA